VKKTERYTYILLAFLLMVGVMLYLKLDAYGFWIDVAFAGLLWLTLVIALKCVCNYIERRGVKARIKRIIALTVDIIEIVAFLFAFIYCYQDVALYHPNSDPASRQYLLSQRDFVEITVEDGNKTYVGYMRLRNDVDPSPTVIMFIGNAQNAAQTMASMDAMKAWTSFPGYNVLIMDYPGYGLSDGKPSGGSISREALLTYDFVSDLPYVDANRIIIGGFSIGTGPAAYLAANRDVDGLFLLAPYASGHDLYNSVLPIFHGPMRLLVKSKFPSYKYAPSITAPVLIVASKDDELVPFASSERLTTFFRSELTFVTLSGVKHNSIFYSKTVLDSIRSFLESIQ